MNKVSPIEFKKIRRISPSQFYSMKNCAYKAVLAEAFEKKPLLPVSPNAYLGTVLHKILELTLKGEITSVEELNTRFDEEICLVENKLSQEGSGNLVPLHKNVMNFGIKKILLKKHLKMPTETQRSLTVTKFTSEKWYESKDKLIVGKMDLIIEYENETEIIDFKTGEITQDVLDDSGGNFYEVKKEYQGQLKLYAYLYFDCTGKFPTKLSLVDLTNQKFNVEFSLGECKAIFEEAKELLRETNVSIDTLAFNANPNEENCKYCLYRPACSFYLHYLPGNNFFNDVCGIVKDVVSYKNGNVTVFVQQENKTISLTGFGMDKFEYFNSNRNKQISVYNLRKGTSEFVYIVTKTTKIYEQ